MRRIFWQVAQNRSSARPAVLQREVAEVEQAQALVAGGDGVVVGLQHVLPRHLLVGLEEVAQRRLGVRRRLARQLADLELGDPQHVDHQHRVMGHRGAAGLRDDRRMRHAAGVAHLHEAEDDVVGVLLERVVERRGEVRLRAVVVDAEAAADVEIAQRRAHLDQVDVDLRRLAQAVLDRADRGDLAAEVEVEELEGVEQVVLAQEGDGAEQVAPREAELRAVAARGLPVAGALGGEARADADPRPHPHLLRDLVDQRQLRGLLDHQDHVPAELRGEERRLDVLLVLVAVADDERLLVLQHRHHGEQLGLRARLEAEVIGAAVLDQPLDEIAVLVDLDRIDAAVARPCSRTRRSPGRTPR